MLRIPWLLETVRRHSAKPAAHYKLVDYSRGGDKVTRREWRSFALGRLPDVEKLMIEMLCLQVEALARRV